ncbi:MAG: EamA family transporter [Candidatus Limnocylindrales bacterium]
MSPIVFGLVAAAAIMHAAWNILLKTAGDPLRTSGRALFAGTAVAVPLALAGWLASGRPAIPSEALVLAVVSGLGETVYFVFLSAAYRRGDLSLVYPIARGSAPLLAVGSGVLILGERVGTLGAVGVAALLAGLLAVRRPWQALWARVPWADGDRTQRPEGASPAGPVDVEAARRRREAVLLALATGTMIAVYSSIDRVGTRLVAPWLYVTLLWVVTSVALLTWIRVMDTLRPALAATPGDLPDEVPMLPAATFEGAASGPPGQAPQDRPVTDPAGPPRKSFPPAVPAPSASPGAVPSAPPVVPALAGDWRRSAVIGLLLLGAYLLVLVAFTLAPLTAVAPLRESAVVFASGWGALRLGEASGRRDAAWRVGGSLLIVVGAVLLALEG